MSVCIKLRGARDSAFNSGLSSPPCRQDSSSAQRGPGPEQPRAAPSPGRMKPLCVSAALYLAAYLALCGCVKGALRNSIKTLQNGDSHTGHTDTVSTRPHVPQPDTDHTDTPPSCAADAECGSAEFCNDGRKVCAPCRRRRKRCSRDAMCCAGNRCINGVCQAAEMFPTPSASTAHATQQLEKTDGIAVTRGQNLTHGQQQLKKISISSKSHQTLKGGEGETCLRSSDCSEGLCCARHFWSRICKPVLTEGQVCTRHRRKGTHGLEIFQRCDCAHGLVCRAQKDRAVAAQESQKLPSKPQLPQQLQLLQQQQQSKNNRAARNLHTCQLPR